RDPWHCPGHGAHPAAAGEGKTQGAVVPMSERDELSALAETWLGIADMSQLSLPAARMRRRRQRMLFVGELFGALSMLAFAAWFWLAGDGPVFRTAAALFVAAAVLTVVFAARARTGLGRWA